tara:strand:- start:42 stop:641 length:600 start_codon:yes stop_codon:yes gene_type:complete
VNYTVKESFIKSIELKQKIVDLNLFDSISNMASVISERFMHGNKLMICGNGGSAADAQHLAAEMLVRLRPNNNREGLPAIALTMDVSTLTACGNDLGYDKIFERTLEAIGKSGDILLVITTSGDSNNIILAMKKAKEMGINVYGFLGSEGGKALPYCEESFLVPSNETARVQEAHITAGHSLMELIEDILIEKKFINLK